MYSKSITRSARTLFVLAIDQSASMAGVIDLGSRRLTKAEMVAEVANDLLAELVERARSGDAIRDYYDVAVVGYSGSGVCSLLGESWSLPITQIDAMSVEQCVVKRECKMPNGGIRILSYQERRWIKPVASGTTPMYEALLTIDELVEQWVSEGVNCESFPPQIFNITDGESTDCDYIDIAQISSKIKSHSTRDGAALLFNVHIASQSSQDAWIFPSQQELTTLSNSSAAALSLYNSASDIPPIFSETIREIKGDDTAGSYRAMSYNASVAQLITILNIGTISVKRA